MFAALAMISSKSLCGLNITEKLDFGRLGTYIADLDACLLVGGWIGLRHVHGYSSCL